MRFIRISFQWLIITLLVSIVVWGIFLRKGLPDYDSGQWNQRDGFYAISFKGMAPDSVRNHQFLFSQMVSRIEDWMHDIHDTQYEKEVISKDKFTAFLKILKENGFVPIKTTDIINFYIKGAPLPEKAIYIMFEDGRRDSLIFAHPLLQKMGFNAATYVYGDKIFGSNPFFLRAEQLRDVSQNQFWEVESMGYSSECINADPQKECTYPLTDYLRDTAGKKIESLEELSKRIQNDYAESSKAIYDATGSKPAAYCFLPANTLQLLPKELLQANMDGLRKNYQIAFTRAGSSYNSAIEGRYHLTRFQVPTEWSPDQLLAELNKSAPMHFNDKPLQCDKADLWRPQLGTITAQPHKIFITSPADKDGFALLRGSENLQALSCQTTVHPQTTGESDIYLRYRSPKAYVRVRVLYDTLQVQESTEDGLTTLQQYTLAKPGEPVHLAMEIKGNRFQMWANGILTSQYPLPLGRSVDQGSFGLGARGESGTFTGQFDDVTLHILALRWGEVANPAAIETMNTAGMTAFLIPWEDTANQCPDTTSLMAAAMRGIATYLAVSGDPRTALKQVEECLTKDAGASSLALRLVSGFAATYDPAVPAANYAAAIKAAHAKNMQFALRIDAQDLAAFLQTEGVQPDWFLLNFPDDKHKPDVMLLKHRFDKRTMLFICNKKTLPPALKAVFRRY